jgi:hypothetical protein
MTVARAKEVLALPALIVGGLGALFTGAVWLLGFLQTPKRLEIHMVTEKVYHDSSGKAVSELHSHAQDQERLLEALIRGECIENPKKDLARQGLLGKCRALGIDR